jgi:hypothetical protein
MGESGSGKTCAMRTLNPKETLYIDADQKGLSWRGWRNNYNDSNKNYYKGSIPSKIATAIQRANAKPEIKNVIIDTLNGMMIDEEMRRINEKGYDKWIDMAAYIWDTVSLANTCRDDLNVICVAHTQTERDDNGFYFTRVKTSGRKIDKIVLESKFTTVLLAKSSENGYVFETQANHSTAKTPMGAFNAPEIPNDMQAVIKTLEEF